MSVWTYVRGFIEVEAAGGTTQETCDMIVNTTVRLAPKVTGSERNMQIKVVRLDGDKVHSDDCGQAIDYQSTYMLVLHGDLRDKRAKETKQEIADLLRFIAERLLVCNVYVDMNDDYGDNFKFTNQASLEHMYDCEWWPKYLTENILNDKYTPRYNHKKKQSKCENCKYHFSNCDDENECEGQDSICHEYIESQWSFDNMSRYR